MRNDELIHAVKDELERDPDVDSDVVAVSADDGVVRLRGTVESLGEKHEAEKDARRIPATELVDSQLQVRPLSDRQDAELRGNVLQALALDEGVPPTVTLEPNAHEVRDVIAAALRRNARARAESLSIKTSHGTVTVKGKVRSLEERDAAIEAVRSLEGVRRVEDHITIEL